MVQTHLYSCLSEDTAVAELCATRIYPNLAQQGINEPHIVYQMITTEGEYDSNGAANPRKSVGIDLRCFGPKGHNSPNYTAAHNVAQAARRALEGITAQTIGGSTLLNAEVTNLTDQYDEKTKWHFVVVSAQLYYCEAP